MAFDMILTATPAATLNVPVVLRADLSRDKGIEVRPVHDPTLKVHLSRGIVQPLRARFTFLFATFAAALAAEGFMAAATTFEITAGTGAFAGWTGTDFAPLSTNVTAQSATLWRLDVEAITQ